MAHSETLSPPKRIWQWLSFPMSKNIIHGSLSVHSLVTTITWPLHTGERLLLPIPSHWPLPHRLAKTNTSSSGQRCGLGAWGSHRNQVEAETAQLSQTMTQAPFQKPLQLRLGQLPAASLVMLSAHRDQLGQRGQSRWRKRDGRDESHQRREPLSHTAALQGPKDGLLEGKHCLIFLLGKSFSTTIVTQSPIEDRMIFPTVKENL